MVLFQSGWWWWWWWSPAWVAQIIQFRWLAEILPPTVQILKILLYNRLPSASFDEWWSVFCMLGVPGSCTIIIIILRVLAEIEFYKRTIMATCYKYCLELLEELQTSAVIFSKYFPPNTAKYFLQKPTQIFSPVSWQERIKCRAQHSSLKYKIWKNCPDFNVDVQRKVKQ